MFCEKLVEPFEALVTEPYVHESVLFKPLPSANVKSPCTVKSPLIVVELRVVLPFTFKVEALVALRTVSPVT